MSCTVNADVGEGCGQDRALFQWVDLANVACGGHAGDAESMQVTIGLALEHGVLAGAHPSYPDREGFGRRRPEGPLGQLYGQLCAQIEAFESLASRAGLKTSHFKPHGQLYNDAAFNAEIAGLLLRVAGEFPHLALVALANSPLLNWAEDEGVITIPEAFPDRGYLCDGRLVPRHLPGACVNDLARIESQALALATGGEFLSVEGNPLSIQADTLCIHGDSPQATAYAQAVVQALRLVQPE